MNKFLMGILLCSSVLTSPLALAGGIVIESEEPTVNGKIPEKKPLPGYFAPGTKHPLGVRPDCSEKKIDIKNLESMFKNKKVKSINDFLLQPELKDAFQTFTLVTNSKSAQRGAGDGQVSDEWPRVLRTSADGKITLSYTCNPKSQAYNQVEIIYYDDNGKKMNTMSVNLAQEPQNRVHHNDGKCLTCHATTMPDGSKSVKPIWPEYFQWGGCDGKNTINMYGSNDDNMNPANFRSGSQGSEYKDCSEDQLRARQVKEISNFKNFKEKNLGTGANNNPCYSTLPWAKPTGGPKSQYDPAKFENYPYSTNKTDVDSSGNDDGNENYYLRPNLKFTEMYARLNANRIAALIEKNPAYEKMKYFLAMEAADCLKPEDEKTIQKLFPNLDYKFQKKNMSGFTDPRQSSPLLYQFGKSIGISDADWTLEFKGENPEYTAAIPRHALRRGQGPDDTGIGEVASGSILRTIAAKDPNIAPAFKDALSTGVSEGFGPQWSCIDDVGGSVRPEYQGDKRPLCVSIRKSLQTFLANTAPDCLPPQGNDSQEATNLAQNTQLITGTLNDQKISHGKKILEQKCLHCHQSGVGSPASIVFFEDPAKPVSAQEKEIIKRRFETKFLSNVEEYLKDGTMPVDSDKLTDVEQVDLIQYVESLSRKK